MTAEICQCKLISCHTSDHLNDTGTARVSSEMLLLRAALAVKSRLYEGKKVRLAFARSQVSCSESKTGRIKTLLMAEKPRKLDPGPCRGALL